MILLAILTRFVYDTGVKKRGEDEMLKIERQNIVEKELKKHGCILVPELSNLLNCSEETVRRDLKEMESAGKLTRTHGGAYLVEKYDKSYPTGLRKAILRDSKEKLAACAIRHIAENEVIMLDSSTTCLVLAEVILQAGLHVTLITNSLAICDLCNDYDADIDLVCLGGELRKRSSAFVGYHATEMISRYCADKAFISCPKVTLEQGMSDNNLKEAKVRETMLDCSKERILLMDYTKFDESANVRFGALEKINVLVTDAKLTPVWMTYAKENNIVIENA